LQVNNNLSVPLRIASIRVDGAINTRRSFLSSLIKFHIQDPSLPTFPHNHPTLESVLLTTRRISHILQETDIFQSVEAKIEKSSGALAEEGDVDIVFKTREKGRFFLNTSTEVGNGEGNAVSSFSSKSLVKPVLTSYQAVTARVRNVFGGAELLEGNLSFGTKTRHSYRALFSAPLTNTLNTRGELTVFELERDNSSYASSYEGLRGIKATVRVS
jgi:outer membrane protein insertion porin family